MIDPMKIDARPGDLVLHLNRMVRIKNLNFEGEHVEAILDVPQGHPGAHRCKDGIGWFARARLSDLSSISETAPTRPDADGVARPSGVVPSSVLQAAPSAPGPIFPWGDDVKRPPDIGTLTPTMVRVTMPTPATHVVLELDEDAFLGLPPGTMAQRRDEAMLDEARASAAIALVDGFRGQPVTPAIGMVGDPVRPFSGDTSPEHKYQVGEMVALRPTSPRDPGALARVVALHTNGQIQVHVRGGGDLGEGRYIFDRQHVSPLATAPRRPVKACGCY